MLKKIVWALFLVCGLRCIAQPSPGSAVIFVTSAPSGSCTNGSPAQLVISTGHIWTCQGGTWVDATGSGGGSGFPITIGSTSISSGSTTTSIAGLTIDGVTPTTMGFVDPTSSIQTQLNGKQATGNYITALTGDGAASGPGSAGFTLATVNSAPGSCGDATHVCQVTTNGKGLVTSQSAVAITGSGVTLQTNTINNSSQATLNLINSSTNTAGLTSTFTNTTGGTVQGEIAGLLNAGHGGTGIANTATLTLGTSNQNWATLGTGIVKNTTTTGGLSDAASSDVIALWTGTCSSSTFLNGAGACATPGTINGAAQFDVPYYSAAGTATTLSGAAISGFQFDSTSGAPLAATATNLGALANIAQFDVIVSGGTAAALTGVAPSATSGLPLLSQGSSSNPTYAAISLAAHATQAADTFVANATAGSAAPTAVAMPTTTHGVWLGEGTASAPGITAAGAVGTFLAGAGASTDPSFSALSAINPQTTTYQVVAADFSGYKTITVASGTFTITLVASGSQPAAGQYINVLNYGSGVITIARSGQNINGGTGSITLNAGSATAPTSSTVWSDGTNYFAIIDEGTTGTVTTTGTPSSGQMAAFSGATSITTATAANLGTLVNLATNSIVYSGGTSAALLGVTPVNNAVLSTNGSGVPSEGTTLPSGLAATNLALTTPALGTPSSGVLTNATGYLLNNVAAATGSATIASGNNPITWNWAQTTASQYAMTFGETTAKSGAGGGEVLIQTASGSTGIPLTVQNSLSGTQTLAALTITPTWNTTGVVDAALLVNPTNTASGTGSLLADFQLGGTSEFKIDKAGNATATTSVVTGTSPGLTAGTAGFLGFGEGTAPTNASGAAGLYADSTTHEFEGETNGSSSPGIMVRTRPGSINQTGKTSSITTATLCAASAGACNIAGTYHIHFSTYQTGTACTTANATGGLSIQVTFTDGNGVTHSTFTVPLIGNSLGTAATGFITNGVMLWGSSTSTLTSWASGDLNVDTNGTVIQYATTYSNCSVAGTATYAVVGTVDRIR